MSGEATVAGVNLRHKHSAFFTTGARLRPIDKLKADLKQRLTVSRSEKSGPGPVA